MKSRENKFVDRLKDLELTPAEDSFDLIFENYNKPERKKRWALMGLLAGLMAAVISLIIITSKDHSIDKVQHSYKSEIAQKFASNKAETISDKVFYDNSKTKEVSQPFVTPLKKQKDQALGDNSYEKPKPSSNSNPIIKNKQIALRQDQTHSFDSGINNEQAPPIINAEKENTYSEVFEKAKKQNINTIAAFPKNNGLSSTLIARLPLLLSTIEHHRIINLLDKPVINPIKPRSNSIEKFSIGIIAESGQQQFCSFAKAKQKRWGISMSKSISHRLSFLASYSRSSVAYSFSYTDELKVRFGNTDKYPVLAIISDKTESLSNNLTYSSIDIGMQFKLLYLKHHTLSLILSQEFVLTQNQEFTYLFTDQKNYAYLKTSNDVQVHQIRPSLLYTYQISDHFQFMAKLSYNYSLNYIGLEKEKYSGYNLGLGMTYVY